MTGAALAMTGAALAMTGAALAMTGASLAMTKRDILCIFNYFFQLRWVLLY